MHIVKKQENPMPSCHRLEYLEHGKIRSERVGSVFRWSGPLQHHVEGTAQRARQIRGKLPDRPPR